MTDLEMTDGKLWRGTEGTGLRLDIGIFNSLIFWQVTSIGLGAYWEESFGENKPKVVQECPTWQVRRFILMRQVPATAPSVLVTLGVWVTRSRQLFLLPRFLGLLRQQKLKQASGGVNKARQGGDIVVRRDLTRQAGGYDLKANAVPPSCPIVALPSKLPGQLMGTEEKP